jgi:hypothetical protein
VKPILLPAASKIYITEGHNDTRNISSSGWTHSNATDDWGNHDITSNNADANATTHVIPGLDEEAIREEGSSILFSIRSILRTRAFAQSNIEEDIFIIAYSRSIQFVSGFIGHAEGVSILLTVKNPTPTPTPTAKNVQSSSSL